MTPSDFFAQSSLVKRRIANPDQNAFVANGVDPHKATRIAPDSLLNPLKDEVVQVLKQNQKETEDLLSEAIGRPFYSDLGFILYNGDCTEFLKSIRKLNIQVDLTLTSPPYNIGKEYESPMSCQEYIDWCIGWMNQIHALTVPNGSFWLNVGYFEVPDKGLCIPIPYLIWDKSPFYLLQEIVWKYGAGVSAKRRLSPRNEKWLFYVNNPDSYTFNLNDIRDPNVKYPNQKKNGKFRCNPLGKNPSDVWEFPKVTTGSNRCSRERSGHPAQFPLGVIERIVRASSNELDLVLDPFAGSCSAGIAAAGLGRLFLGFEIRADYCRLAAIRFKEFRQAKESMRVQSTLF